MADKKKNSNKKESEKKKPEKEKPQFDSVKIAMGAGTAIINDC